MSDTTSDNHDPFDDYGAHKLIPYQNLPLSPSIDLKVLQTSSWSYAGPSLKPHETLLPPSLRKWASITFSDPSILIKRLLPLLSFLQILLEEAGITHYWLTIRATQPTHDYDTPRWHIDDDFFAAKLPGVSMKTVEPPTTPSTPSSKRSRSNSSRIAPFNPRRYKLCTTLLGPSTLFLPLPFNSSALTTLHRTRAALRSSHEHDCSSIRCPGCSTYSDAVRSSLACQFSSSPTISARPGEVVCFRIGDEEGAVHSEPRCNVNRIFVNVVPGSKEELAGLTGRWGMGFPRAWCLGGKWARSDESGDIEGWNSWE